MRRILDVLSVLCVGAGAVLATAVAVLGKQASVDLFAVLATVTILGIIVTTLRAGKGSDVQVWRFLYVCSALLVQFFVALVAIKYGKGFAVCALMVLGVTLFFTGWRKYFLPCQP